MQLERLHAIQLGSCLSKRLQLLNVQHGRLRGRDRRRRGASRRSSLLLFSSIRPLAMRSSVRPVAGPEVTLLQQLPPPPAGHGAGGLHHVKERRRTRGSTNSGEGGGADTPDLQTCESDYGRAKVCKRPCMALE